MIALGAAGYDVGVSIAADMKGTAAADHALTKYPDLTHDQYSAKQTTVSDRYYNRYSISSNFSSTMSSIYSKK